MGYLNSMYTNDYDYVEQVSVEEVSNSLSSGGRELESPLSHIELDVINDHPEMIND